MNYIFFEKGITVLSFIFAVHLVRSNVDQIVSPFDANILGVYLDTHFEVTGTIGLELFGGVRYSFGVILGDLILILGFTGVIRVCED